MKLARVLFLAAASFLLFGGCAKATDLTAQQQETVAYARSYDERLYEMYQRANDYLARLKEHEALPGSQDAHNALSRMNSVYKGMKSLVRRERSRHLADTIPNQVDVAIKAGKPDALRNIAMGLGVNPAPPGSQPAPATDMHVELQRVMDSLHARMEDGYVEANAHLDAVEAWLTRVDAIPDHHDLDPPREIPHPPPGPPDKDEHKDEKTEEKKDEPKKDEPPAGGGSGSAAPPAGAGAGSAAPPQPAKGSAAAPQPAKGSAAQPQPAKGSAAPQPPKR